MFVFRRLEDWRQGVMEAFTKNTEDRPTTEELNKAYYNFLAFYNGLDACKTAFNLFATPYTEGLELIKQVEQALRDDHGGVLPRDIFNFWWDQRYHNIRDHRTFATPEEKNAMVAIYERWKDKDKIKKQFWALPIDEPEFKFGARHRTRFSDERCWQVTYCLREWLQKRKDGQVY
ncbi:hypothetical protein ACJ72_01073 [Emergomyces africanus]|uniref:Uncharacterized protein n=1 Tax=Emergomyces africanus TaxID=1955775 RepID=A0A1B7P695_9EURO|nr:hypothetical protein ACJ72_01073 [Emergomyces africanus]